MYKANKSSRAHKLEVAKEIIGSMKLARVNQHPPVHQLAILSIGWAAFLHPVPNPVLTQHSTTINLFGMLTFDPFYFFGCFFPTLTILAFNLIILATLLT
jgi:hypothetical protein